jgi:hypothetical protein
VPEADSLAGWSWLEAAAEDGDATPTDLCRAAAACLGSPDERLLVRHLRRLFLDRRLPPTASNAELRHLEGQRAAVDHLLRLASAAATPLRAR